MGSRNQATMRLSLLPVADIHLRKASDRATVTTLGIVGALALLIAVVNYVNLATARAALRAREVAVRKALGATRAALARQFVGEAVVTALLAALAGLALVEVALPFVNALGGTTLALQYGGLDGAVLPVMALALIVGAGRRRLSRTRALRFQPAAVLASARTPGGGRVGARVREALVIVQFAIATALTIGTLVLVAQVDFLRAADLGFRRDGLILVTSLNDASLTPAQRTQLVSRFGALPGVTAATQSELGPGVYRCDERDHYGATRSPRRDDHLDADRAGLLPRLRCAADRGTVPGDAFGADDSGPKGARDRGLNVVLNASATRSLGFATPASAVGQIVQRREADLHDGGGDRGHALPVTARSGLSRCSIISWRRTWARSTRRSRACASPTPIRARLRRPCGACGCRQRPARRSPP